MNSIKVKAYAKINWALNITGEAENGYHLLDMLMQSVSLSDELTIEKNKPQSLVIEGRSDLSCGEDNLIIKAQRALEAYVEEKLPCAFTLEKNIPIAAGLAGGSADAAAAMVGLNALFELGLTPGELSMVAAKVGSDIPFCLYGGFQRATGTGTELKRLKNPENINLVIIKPCEGLSTAEVYKNSRIDTSADIDASIDAIQNGRIEELKETCTNALFAPASNMRPAIAKAIAELYENGAAFAAMSGSGPSVFGIFETQEAAKNALDSMHDIYSEVYQASTHIYGLEFISQE